MLNTHKVLYILPDLAYLAELLPGKKAHSFEIQSFKQYNGELIKDGKFIQENLVRLFKKLEAEDYDVILPDDLFTNTIIDVEKKTEKEVKEYLKDEVIPSLHIDGESHQIQTFILSEYKGSYKVQLSTIQKKCLSPLKGAAQGMEANFKRIFPLSWAIKSLISLEPSISVLQLGEHLFMAKHYIGVDQPLVDKIDNLDRFVEAIKTMKGTEPSLQTVYLLTDESVEEELKEKLEGAIPLQQLADASQEQEDGVPDFLEKAITAAIKTISVPDFEIPQFGLKDVEAAELSAIKEDEDKDLNKASVEKIEVVDEDGADTKEVMQEEELPKPGTKEADQLQEEEIEEEKVQVELAQDSLESDEEAEKEEEVSQAAKPEEEPEVQEEKDKQATVAQVKPDDEPQPVASVVSESKDSSNDKDESPAVVISPDNDSGADVDLKKFASVTVEAENKQEAMPMTKRKSSKNTKVLKNNDGTGSFIKLFLIGLGSFVLTIAIGVGVGYGLLHISQPSTDPIEEPQVEWTDSEDGVDETDQLGENGEIDVEDETVDEVESEIRIDRSEYSLRVVNATTRAGYAGTIASALEEAGFPTVDAKNAVEDYEAGVYVLMEEESADLISVLSEDLDLELSYLEGVEAEDPRGEFDAVVVLAE